MLYGGVWDRTKLYSITYYFFFYIQTTLGQHFLQFARTYMQICAYLGQFSQDFDRPFVDGDFVCVNTNIVTK